jgi:hypothetical protein
VAASRSISVVVSGSVVERRCGGTSVGGGDGGRWRWRGVGVGMMGVAGSAR